MTVRRLFVGGQMLEVSGRGYEPVGKFSSDGKEVELNESILLLLRAGVLSSDARLERNEAGDKWEVKGDPTEGALIVLAAKAGLDKTELDSRFPRVFEVPFSAETKRMITLHETPEGVIAFAKGAPEIIVQSCQAELTNHGEQPNRRCAQYGYSGSGTQDGGRGTESFGGRIQA